MNTCQERLIANHIKQFVMKTINIPFTRAVNSYTRFPPFIVITSFF